jgi:hypothetical protein
VRGVFESKTSVADVLKAKPPILLQAPRQQPANLDGVSAGSRAIGGSDFMIAASVSVTSSAERAGGRQHLETRIQTPTRRAAIEDPATRLFRRHVGGRAEDHPRMRHLRRRSDRRGQELIARGSDGRLQRLGEAEVEHLDRAVRPHLDVGGLQIAMDDAGVVCGFERIGDLPRDRSASSSGSGPRAMSCDRSSPSTSSMTSARISPASSTPCSCAM